VGIGVVIGNRWRAWRLLPGWKQEGRDIGWAEAIGMELLARYVFEHAPHGSHIKLWGDNNGVVEGWWRGRSANDAVNNVFRRIADYLHQREASAHTRYVESARNPADDPSRGIYGRNADLLPRIPLPGNLRDFIVDFEEPLTCAERQAPCKVPLDKQIDKDARTTRYELNREFKRAGIDLWTDPRFWSEVSSNYTRRRD
jgi:hypothetical protein